MLSALAGVSTGVGLAHGWWYGVSVAGTLAAAGWTARRFSIHGGTLHSMWRRLLNLRARRKIYAWAWQERAALSEAIALVLSRPRGDDPPLFPQTIFERSRTRGEL